MQPSFTYDKASAYFHKQAKNLAIDYNKIAVTNGKIALKRVVDGTVNNGSREFQNNVTLKEANVSSQSRFCDKMFLNCDSLEEAIVTDNAVIDISSAFRNSKITECNFPESAVCASFAYCNTNITTAAFSAPNLVEMKGMFQDCSLLETVELTNLDKVVSANSAFQNCESLTNIDIAIPNATGVLYMFAGCVALTDVYLKCKANRLYNLFSGCSELTNVSLELACKPVILASMFKDSGLESYKVDFDTSSVTHMISMFEDCQYLTSVDLSAVNTSSLVNCMRMFKDCSSLEELDISNFDFSNCTDKMSLFQFLDGTNLKKLTVGKKWTTLTYYNARNRLVTIAGLYEVPFYVTAVEETDDTYKLTLSATPIGFDEETSIRGMEMVRPLPITTTWEEALETAHVEDNMLIVTSNVTGLITDTDKFEYTGIRFVGSQLYNVTFSDMQITTLEFEESNIEINNQEDPIFRNMTNLESIDNLDIDILYQNANEYVELYNRQPLYLFRNCDNVRELKGSNNITTYYIDYTSQYMTCDLPNLTHIDSFSLNRKRKYDISIGEFCQIYASALSSINELTVSLNGASLESMLAAIQTIGKLEITGNCERLFYSVRSLKHIDEVIIGMEDGVRAVCTYMFARCSNLESIGSLILIGDGQYMFNRCTSLKSIDYINLHFTHTEKMTDQWYLNNMFDGCTSLKITADNFDTENNITPMQIIHAEYMFRNAPVDAASIISKLFSEISDSERPFLYLDYAAQNTATSDTSKFILRQPTKVFANYLFSSCPNITEVRMSLTNAASLVGLFKDCVNITNVYNLDIRNDMFDSISEMFSGCSNLHSIGIISINKENIFKAANLFDGCVSLVNYGNMDMSTFPNLKDVTAMFRNNVNLTTYVQLPEMVLHTSYAFYNTAISALNDIYLPSTDDISYMFAECKNLKTVRSITVFDANVRGVFENCSSLETIYLFDLRTILSDNMSGDMFDGCNELKLVQLSEYLHITEIEGTKVLYYEWKNSMGANCKVFNQTFTNMDVFREMQDI